MPKQLARKRKKKNGKSSNIWIYTVVGLVLMGTIYWIIRPREEAGRELAIETDSQESRGIVRTVPEEQPILGDNPLDTAIREAAAKLQVPETALRKREREESVNFQIPLNRNEIDLTFANMIVKGQVELRGGKLERGSETGSRQILVFSLAGVPKPYQVELYYDSAPYRDRGSSKRIAIVVDDFGGISGNLLNGFFALDPAVTFAILPGQPHSELTMQRAQAQGREAIIHVPMEPIGYPRVNPGPEAILIRMTESEIERMLNRFINQLPYCVGINNHMGSLATADEATMAAVMKVLRDRGKYFLDSRTTNVSVAYQMAQKAHIPAYQNRIFLDSPDISDATMEAKLSQIINMAQTNPNLIAITHCHSQEKLDYLRRFINRLEAAGFTLVPVSRLGQQNVPSIL